VSQAIVSIPMFSSLKLLLVNIQGNVIKKHPYLERAASSSKHNGREEKRG